MNTNYPDEPGPAAVQDVLGGFEERLLADLKITVARQAAAWPGREQAATARRAPRFARPGAKPAHRLALAGAASAMLAAAVAITLIATSGAPAGGHEAKATHAGHPASFGPATTAAGVLHNAALAALELPAGAPRPGQFVYTKLYRAQQYDGVGVQESWISADGVQAGLISGGTAATTAYSPGCRDGWYYYPNDLGHHQRCTAAENAAFFPGMPTSLGPLHSWLLRHFGDSASDASGLLTNVESMVTSDYLLPRQQAALYELLARTPGLTVVPRVTNVLGAAGVGIRSGTDKDSIYTIIFNPRTYAPLGMNWTGVDWTDPPYHFKRTDNGEVLLDIAVVNKPGQRH
jgi:hypothetical protein